MGESLFHKLFGAGKEPQAITHALAGEPRIFSCEGISVTVHKSGHVPGAVAHGKVGAHVGGFVVTPRRLLGYMAGGKVLDVPWDFPPGQVVHAWLDPTGLHARWDIPRANPEWKGEMTIHFKQDIAPQQLATFPRTEVWFDVAPQNVAAFFRGRG